MTKAEKERLFKCDLARYLKDDFAEYRKVADRVNYIYTQICYREGTSRPEDISAWEAVKDEKNVLQHKIERKLPQPDMFNSIYRFYGILLKEGTLNQPITDETVLQLVTGAKPHNVGRLRPIGTEFTHIEREGITYIIRDIKTDGNLSYSIKGSSRVVDYPISLFQNNLKNGKIKYVEKVATNEDCREL